MVLKNLILEKKHNVSQVTQLFNDIREFFKAILNNKNISHNFSTSKPKTSKASTLTKNIVKKDDVYDIIKLLENRNSPDFFIKNSIKRLKLILNRINNFKTDDKILNNHLNKIKSNKISSIDIESLFGGEEKAKNIFINNYFNTIYTTNIKNNKNLIDKLKSIDINQINEKAERTPSKKINNIIIEQRRIFISNLPKLLTDLFGLFSFLFDKKRDGSLIDLDIKPKQQPEKQQSKFDEPVSGGPTPKLNRTDTDNKWSYFWVNEIDTHNNLQDLLYESMDKAIKNSYNGRIMQAMISDINKITNTVFEKYKEMYGDELNRVKLSEFLTLIFKTLQTKPTKTIVDIVGKEDFTVKNYRSLLSGIKQKSSDTEGNDVYLPDTINNFNLKGLNRNARLAITNRAVELLKQRSGVDQTKDNIDKVINQILSTINKIEPNKIPKIG